MEISSCDGQARCFVEVAQCSANVSEGIGTRKGYTYLWVLVVNMTVVKLEVLLMLMYS